MVASSKEITEERRFQWCGHSAFSIEVGAAKTFIDPFLFDKRPWK
jgi:L-ascorbate metabolism protein UlaG (beta-lactamase superfamily)